MVEREVEVKILEVDKDAMVKTLLSLGAEKVFDDDMRMRSFKSEVAGTLRVREEGDRILLALKSKAVRDGFSAQGDEYSVEVDDFDAAVQIIEQLGLPLKWDYTRHRTSYALDGVRFEFDKPLGDLAHVPEYLEIEAKDEASLKDVIKKLGIPDDKVLDWTAGDVIRHYRS